MDRKDSYVVVTYGDSITKGVVYDNERSKYFNSKNNFTSIVSSKINGTVYNVGKFGSTIVRGINKTYKDVIKKTPDIVLIEFGGNDCDYNWEEVALNPNIEHKPNTDISTFSETLRTMIASLKKDNIVPALMTLPPLDPIKYFNWIGKGDPLAEKNILQWLGCKEKLYTWHNSYNQAISQIATETQTILIDVRTEFLKYTNYSQFLCLDGIHPNNEGHSLIAKILLGFMQDNYSFLLQN